MTVLTQASTQWASRPADQRFNSLDDLHAAVTHHREVAVEAPNVSLKSLSVEVENGETPRPILVGATGQRAEFTHYSFGQFSRKLGAPAEYLRNLSAPLAVANLTEGLQTAIQDDATSSKLLFAQNGSLVLRAMTGDGYARIWNNDITSRLIRLREQNPEWQEAPAAFDGSRGMYGSDKDMFAFMVDNSRRIFESLPGGGLSRGFFASNSEVGDASFCLMTFLYEYCCGNHRVWGVSEVKEARIRHVGAAPDKAFASLSLELTKYANASATDDELKIASARTMTLGATKDEVLDKVFGLRISGLSRGLIGQSYDRAVEKEDLYGNPQSVWGLTGGMTEIARDLPNTDDRVALDRAAGKVMQIAF